MNSFSWVVEPCLFDNDNKYNEAVQYIESLGDVVREARNTTTPEVDCCLASLSTANRLGFYDKSDFRVSSYINEIPEWYLNKDCVFYPFGLLSKDIYKNQLFDKFKYTDKLFLKSDSGFKVLTGNSILKSGWDKEIKYLTNINSRELMVISSHKEIDKEYRFWIIDGNVVTFSSYSWKDEPYSEVPEYMVNTAKIISKRINLEMYTLDLCTTKNNIYPEVVELNNIFTSGTYDCNIEKLIDSLRAYIVDNYITESVNGRI